MRMVLFFAQLVYYFCGWQIEKISTTLQWKQFRIYFLLLWVCLFWYHGKKNIEKSNEIDFLQQKLYKIEAIYMKWFEISIVRNCFLIYNIVEIIALFYPSKLMTLNITYNILIVENFKQGNTYMNNAKDLVNNSNNKIYLVILLWF